MITFFVPGLPRSTQSGSVVTVRGRAFPLRRGTSWSSVCGLVATQHAPRSPLTGPLHVTLMFTMPTPKKSAHGYPRRPDLGNASKGVLDAMNGVIYADDSQIVKLIETKEHGVKPGVTVFVGEHAVPPARERER